MATATTLSTAVQSYLQGVVDTVDSQNTKCLNLFTDTPCNVDSGYRWAVHYLGNASTVSYTEGDADPPAGYEGYAEATVAASSYYLKTAYSLTGHAKDAVRNGRFDAIRMEAEGAAKAHMAAVEAAFITALVAAVDSSGSYAGLTRSTYKLASTEDTAGAALAKFVSTRTTLMGSTIQAPWERMVILDNAADREADYLAVAAGVQYMEFAAAQADGRVDASKDRMPTFAGRPFVDIPGMTSGVHLFLPLDVVRKVVYRAPTVQLTGVANDTDTYTITSCIYPVVLSPRICGKLT